MGKPHEPCLSCQIANPQQPTTTHVHLSRHISCNHYLGSDTPGDTPDSRSGWFIIAPRRHVTRLFDLTTTEWSEITALAGRLDHAMTQRFHVGRTILASLGWNRTDHIHFHVVPTALAQADQHGQLQHPDITHGWLNFGGTTETGTSHYQALPMPATRVTQLIRDDLHQGNPT